MLQIILPERCISSAEPWHPSVHMWWGANISTYVPIGAVGATQISLKLSGLAMAGVTLEQGRVPWGHQPRLLWMGSSPRTPGRVSGQVGLHHPVRLWMMSQTRLLRFLFYCAEVAPGVLSWGCCSTEVSCEGTRLSVCLGLSAVGPVLLRLLRPCRASLPLSPSLLREGRLQANAAFPLPLV